MPVLRPPSLLRRLVCAGLFAGGGLAALSATEPPPPETFRFENPRARIVLAANGRWAEVWHKAGRRNVLAAEARIPVALAVMDGKSIPVHRIRPVAGAKNRLRLEFPPATRVTCRVQVAPDWFVFRVEQISGPRPERLALLRVPLTITAHVGSLLGAAYDDRTAVCLRAAGLQATGTALRRKGWCELRTTTQDAPGPRIEGAAAALIICTPASLDLVLEKAADAFGLPVNRRDGRPAKAWPMVRNSYWFLAFGEKDVDRVIRLCHRSGFRQVLLSFGAWSTSAGHYPINRRNFPDGLDSLRRTIRRLHDAGILVGMHTFASKVSKRDAYVTPVPDKRFWKDRTATLAEDVSPTQTAIRVRENLAQWPGSPVCRQTAWEGGVRKHMEVVIDDEIIQYGAIGPPGRWDTFMECRRGAWNTHPAAHKAGTRAFHYGVDGCINGYIIDQETSLLDEVAARLAGIFDACDFDMIYFDGGEDVDRRRFDYYVTRHQAAVIGRIRKRPVLHMGTIPTHRLWHSFARAGTVDTWPATLGGWLLARDGARSAVRMIREVRNGIVRRSVEIELDGGKTRKWRTVKEHIDRSVARVRRFRESKMPAELGWFGIWPRRAPLPALQLDEAEYLMVKSLAWDAPVSFQTNFRQMDANPLTPQILEIARTYEQMRTTGPRPPADLLARLRETGRDFFLVRRGNKSEFVEMREIDPPGNAGDDVRMFLGATPDAAGAVLVFWTDRWRPGSLVLTPPPQGVDVTDFAGAPMPCELRNGRMWLPIDNRRITAYFPGRSPEQVRTLLAAADVQWRPPANIWLQAERPAARTGRTAINREIGLQDASAFGGFVVCTGRLQRTKRRPWYWEYRVDLPHAGRWTVWARVRYPAGVDHSFWFVPLGPDGSEMAAVVLGNCGGAGAQWHWTGTGAGLATKPPGLPITLKLDKGRFVFRVYPREGPGRPENNPRLDCLCLSDDPDYRPTDADAEAELGREQ